VAIDPAVTSGEEADETGIVVAGKDKNGHGYVLDDISGRYPSTEWARLAISAYVRHRADRIVAEVNNGGDMVGATLRMVDPNVAFSAVRASRGKVVRAEPVAALYQQGRVHHIGTFPQLEDQMTNFTSDIDRAAAGYSPDRVDALVWAFSELLVEPMKSEGIYARSTWCARSFRRACPGLRPGPDAPARSPASKAQGGSHGRWRRSQTPPRRHQISRTYCECEPSAGRFRRRWPAPCCSWAFHPSKVRGAEEEGLNHQVVSF
jgi:predicted phage terminase large subunit-like protein